MPKNKKTTAPDVRRELSFMNDLSKLVHDKYPKPDEESSAELFRVFTWALSRFAPEPPTASERAIEFLKEHAEKMMNPPMPPSTKWIPGIPPAPGN